MNCFTITAIIFLLILPNSIYRWLCAWLICVWTHFAHMCVCHILTPHKAGTMPYSLPHTCRGPSCLASCLPHSRRLIHLCWICDSSILSCWLIIKKPGQATFKTEIFESKGNPLGTGFFLFSLTLIFQAHSSIHTKTNWGNNNDFQYLPQRKFMMGLVYRWWRK